MNGTDNSKRIYFQTKKGQVVEWSTKLKKIVHRFLHLDHVIDLIVHKNEKMYTSTEEIIKLWDCKHRFMLRKFYHKDSNFIYMVYHNDTLHFNAYSADVFSIEETPDDNETYHRHKYHEDSGWVHFTYSPDGSELV